MQLCKNFTKTIKGKLVKAAYILADGEVRTLDLQTEIANDTGKIAIVFEDNTCLVVWNSEWGGVDYFTSLKEAQRQI